MKGFPYDLSIPYILDAPLPRPGIDPRHLKNLSNDELIALETAYEIFDRSGSDQDP
jgi:hypothetical protein